MGGDCGWWREVRFRATEESAVTRMWRAKRRYSRTEDRCRPALTSPRGLSAHPPGWGGCRELRLPLQADPRKRTGWLREHSLKGAGTPELVGREYGKRSGTAEEARDFFLPLCFLALEERGFREPLKGAPDTGPSRGYQRGHQRWA